MSQREKQKKRGVRRDLNVSAGKNNRAQSKGENLTEGLQVGADEKRGGRQARVQETQVESGDPRFPETTGKRVSKESQSL